ncbi:hypothetical protein AXG93_673s1400 [Marchantia polymorpha subsp. ruderalis]|uniref:C-terminal of Roc (COR) domain-containing protein n=1 Tax=Marchantia polymorpha subsp. ruderalis TaxID=1480154 RepID=A0A176WJY9_MARPO|nr:hypothetical protein AXG93_673s1400 [Marchantia polymorpha subsp. ruderalis]
MDPTLLRGMGPADEEPELPFAVQNLIRSLEGRAEPLRWLPTLISPDLQDFFPERPGNLWNKTIGGIGGWRREVRLQVLEAIGRCNTFHSLDVNIISGGDIWRLTAGEWVVLLRGFRHSTILRAIRVERLRWKSLSGVESLCSELGEILKTSSAKELKIVNCRLSARCFRNLAKYELKLESLELRNAWGEDSSAVMGMADMIKRATRLETLEIGGSEDRLFDMDVSAAEYLSRALIQSRSLKILVLNEVKDDLSQILLRALDGVDVDRAIECLHLKSSSGLGDCLRDLLRSNPDLKEVTLADIDMQPEKWGELGEAIRENATARTIHVTYFMHHIDSLKGIEQLACAASSDVKDPIMELKIKFTDYKALISALNFVGRVLRGEIKSLKSLILFMVCSCPSGSNHDRMERIVPMDGNPGETSVLKRLRLFQGRDTLKGVWKYLLCCLRENTSVTHLDLSDSTLDDEAFRELMGMLQVNLTVQQIDVSRTAWAEDGKAALIQQALRENQNRAGYMSVFREARLTFGDAKAGRLFLCGSPRAGKTRLRQTLMSPICEIRSHKWGIKPQSCFERELEEWMRFITSSTRVIGHSLPQVLVVMSHKDKVKDTSFTWANTIVDKVTKKFAKNVKLNQEWFHVDARKKKQHFQSQKTESFDERSSYTSKDGYVEETVFAWLIDQVLQKQPHRGRVVDKEMLENILINLDLCFKLKDTSQYYIPLFIPEHSTMEVQRPEEGAHIRIQSQDEDGEDDGKNKENEGEDEEQDAKDEDGEKADGKGENEDGKDGEGENEDGKGEEEDGKDEDGEVENEEEDGEGEHEEEDGEREHEEEDGEGEHEEGDGEDEDSSSPSCEEDEDSSSPSCEEDGEDTSEDVINFLDSDSEHASMEEQKHEEGGQESMHWHNRDENSQFIGIRIECQDVRTMSLTAAFFLRFQMFMRRKLISKMDVSKESVTCSRNYLLLFLDGHQIYVHQERNHTYVDVLMLCSKDKSRKLAQKYVMKHIVEELILFCASPKGCPGVALVLGVIQTLCVEMLNPSHQRRAILIEKLKSDFIRSINDKLEEMPLESSHLVRKEELFNYEHCWLPYEGGISERARDLLWQSDVEAIVNLIRQKQIQQFESLQKKIQRFQLLQEGLNSMDYDLALSTICDSNFSRSQEVKSQRWEKMDVNMVQTFSSLSQESTSVENRSTLIVLRLEIQILDMEMQSLEMMEMKIGETLSLQRLEMMEMKMGQILSLQREYLLQQREHLTLTTTMSAFNSKVDRIIEYSPAFQQVRMPKRPYITNNIGRFFSISSNLFVGNTIWLHLMCESATGFHMVKDQKGLKLRLDGENRWWIRSIMEISFKIIYYAAKAGLDVTIGLDQAIPGWEDLKSDIVRLDGYSDTARSEVLKSTLLKEAWLKLQQCLAGQLIWRYMAKFKLHLVSLELGGHAWMCEECMRKGQSRRILTV